MTLSSFEYHSQTSYSRGALGGHFLDWRNQPDVFKSCGSDVFLLPRETELPEKGFVEVLESPGIAGDSVQRLDVALLSRILFASYGITGRSRQGGPFYFRTSASAGALYPTEIYVVVEDIAGVDPGLYHYSVSQHGLERVRTGDFLSRVSGAFVPPPREPLRIAFLFTVIFFRSAWKYRDRSYRYHLLDTGHVLENWSLAFRAHGMMPGISHDFKDVDLAEFLGLDPDREAVLALGYLPGAGSTELRPPSPVKPLGSGWAERSRVAEHEIDYPLVKRMHRAGHDIRKTGEPVERGTRHVYAQDAQEWRRLPEGGASPTPGLSYAETVLRRRSHRNFVPRELPWEKAASLLRGLCSALDEDIRLHGSSRGSPAVAFAAGSSLQGLAEGLYRLDPERRRVAARSCALPMKRLAAICLDQEWLAGAALHVAFMVNLAELDEVFGARGYRYALMAAGRLGERLYLHATALGLGCCGIGAFYDEEAAEMLELNAESRLLYLVGVGPVKSL